MDENFFLPKETPLFFLAQFNEWHLHAKCHCYTVEGKRLVQLIDNLNE